MERVDNIGFGDLTLIQDSDAFCYGIDAVLLADFAASESNLRESQVEALDIGTNTGIVPLILSHKTAWHILGIEVQKSAFLMAERNISGNKLENRIKLVNDDVLSLGDHFPKGSMDIVTINPPYQEGFSGITSDNEKKMIARHETTASLEDFLREAALVLKPRGQLFLVHRPSRLCDLMALARKHKLEPKTIRFVSPKEGEEPNIVLIKYVKNAGKELKYLRTLSVYKEDGSYEDEILKIYEK